MLPVPVTLKKFATVTNVSDKFDKLTQISEPVSSEKESRSKPICPKSVTLTSEIMELV